MTEIFTYAVSNFHAQARPRDHRPLRAARSPELAALVGPPRVELASISTSLKHANPQVQFNTLPNYAGRHNKLGQRPTYLWGHVDVRKALRFGLAKSGVTRQAHREPMANSPCEQPISSARILGVHAEMPRGRRVFAMSDSAPLDFRCQAHSEGNGRCLDTALYAELS
jgi:hypothetical protein